MDEQDLCSECDMPLDGDDELAAGMCIDCLFEEDYLMAGKDG